MTAEVSPRASGTSGAGTPQLVKTRTTSWQITPYGGMPTGAAFAALSRVQYTPFYLPDGTGITAIAINVTSAGAASNVVRLGLYNADPTTKLPTTVLDQGTVAADSTGFKTLTLGATRTPSGADGLFWVAACPQGAGAPGSVWMCAGGPGFLPQHDVASSWAGLVVPYPSFRLDSVTGAFADNPVVVSDGGTQRFIYAAVRVA